MLQCYVQYMNFARRAEGIKSARAVFKMAREDKRSTYHAFVAAALMEFYCSKVSCTIPPYSLFTNSASMKPQSAIGLVLILFSLASTSHLL